MTQLKIITWNIWFHEMERSRRALRILYECISMDPDIICFQEVTEDSFKIISQNKKNYHIIGGPLNQAYDTIILSKHIPLSFDRFSLPKTDMGRNLLSLNITKGDKEIQICTFHLESVFTGSKKLEQLNYIKEITTDDCILLGDTNFTAETTPEGLIDIFEKINEPEAFRDTYSGRTNKNIKNKKYNSRLDRIYVKNPEIKISRFFLLGTNASFFYNNRYTHLSDHYGIYTELFLS